MPSVLVILSDFWSIGVVNIITKLQPESWHGH